MPKLLEFIETLKDQIDIYGDHDVVMPDESDPSVTFDEEMSDEPVFVIE